jgi:hypothetical protein
MYLDMIVPGYKMLFQAMNVLFSCIKYEISKPSFLRRVCKWNLTPRYVFLKLVQNFMTGYETSHLSFFCPFASFIEIDLDSFCGPLEKSLVLTFLSFFEMF